MTTIVTGTPERQDTHSSIAAPIGLALSMGIPMLLIAWGIIAEGFAAISWTGAVIWGVAATVVFTLFSMMGKTAGMTDMDLLDLLGSVVAEPHSPQSKAIGAVIHHINGVILAIGGAYGAVLFGTTLDWVTGAVWGLILWLLALLMMSTIGAVHPAIRARIQDDPGPGATNFGSKTPLSSLMGHLVWGIVLGVLYQNWPLT